MFEKELREQVKSRAEAYGLSRLAEASGLSRQAIYEYLEGGDIHMSNLLRLLGCLGLELGFEAREATDEDVLGHIKRYGGPLVVEDPHVPMGLEEALCKAVMLSRRESRLTSVLPFLLVKRVYQLDFKKMLSLLEQDPNAVQLMGYFVDVALSYRYRKPLDKFRKQLKWKWKHKEALMLSVRDVKKSLKYFDRFENKPAKDWLVGTRDDLNSLVDRCRKWEALAKTA